MRIRPYGWTRRRSGGNCLLIQANIEYKLVDIPEMKYTSDDKDEEGNPTPRG